ncbi:hypothetical protein CANCADRAFT_3616 [Tortispora caseinolytica NRRL Y-17796]|uniref:Uncharacterized protein n=1 Tax=Tortispora caseinolytica NRRL Y-17796 TaxID=767744 RepID=A0A1E4TB38_9ASCO|nr:hypothetical protein CANCADRAFT_3616 [Tortispora caseinolytica NRRL Y-17796]
MPECKPTNTQSNIKSVSRKLANVKLAPKVDWSKVEACEDGVKQNKPKKDVVKRHKHVGKLSNSAFNTLTPVKQHKRVKSEDLLREKYRRDTLTKRKSLPELRPAPFQPKPVSSQINDIPENILEIAQTVNLENQSTDSNIGRQFTAEEDFFILECKKCGISYRQMSELLNNSRSAYSFQQRYLRYLKKSQSVWDTIQIYSDKGLL